MLGRSSHAQVEFFNGIKSPLLPIKQLYFNKSYLPIHIHAFLHTFRGNYQMVRKLQLKGLLRIQDRVSRSSGMKLNLQLSYNTQIWLGSWDAAFKPRKKFWCMNICRIKAWTSLSLVCRSLYMNKLQCSIFQFTFNTINQTPYFGFIPDWFVDERQSSLLNWYQRRAIIEGVAQGLLYLHKHSRLRVVHRDLKASNILLDQDMNPKISDFGLARICSSNDAEGNTKRVVGTQ